MAPHPEFGVRNSEWCRGQAPRLRSGQATLEMAVAMILALFLLLGTIRLMLWFAERFVVRQKNYEATRAEASLDKLGEPWTEPSTKLILVDE